MADRVVVRSSADNHVMFSCYKAYYPNAEEGARAFYNHHHTELEISAITGGKGVYTCGGVDYPFSPGDVFFHCGNDVHYFSNIEGPEHPALIAIRFDSRFIWVPGGEFFDSKYLKLFTQPSNISRRIGADQSTAPIIAGLLEDIFNECRAQQPAYDLLVKAKLLTILANMSRNFYRELEEINAPAISEWHLANMEKSMDYILSHLESPLTLDDLAKVACMSRSYYSTMFKTLNGVSPWDYITGQRIDLAQYRLETTDKPILEISQSCGFNSIANFNRAFKKLTGRTPREFRVMVASNPRTHLISNK